MGHSHIHVQQCGLLHASVNIDYLLSDFTVKIPVQFLGSVLQRVYTHILYVIYTYILLQRCQSGEMFVVLSCQQRLFLSDQEGVALPFTRAIPCQFTSSPSQKQRIRTLPFICLVELPIQPQNGDGALCFIYLCMKHGTAGGAEFQLPTTSRLAGPLIGLHTLLGSFFGSGTPIQAGAQPVFPASSDRQPLW